MPALRELKSTGRLKLVSYLLNKLKFSRLRLEMIKNVHYSIWQTWYITVFFKHWLPEVMKVNLTFPKYVAQDTRVDLTNISSLVDLTILNIVCLLIFLCQMQQISSRIDSFCPDRRCILIITLKWLELEIAVKSVLQINYKVRGVPESWLETDPAGYWTIRWHPDCRSLQHLDPPNSQKFRIFRYARSVGFCTVLKVKQFKIHVNE